MSMYYSVQAGEAGSETEKVRNEQLLECFTLTFSSSNGERPEWAGIPSHICNRIFHSAFYFGSFNVLRKPFK